MSGILPDIEIVGLVSPTYLACEQLSAKSAGAPRAAQLQRR
jgi:Ni,Fe-hydrogenase III small subunit